MARPLGADASVRHNSSTCAGTRNGSSPWMFTTASYRSLPKRTTLHSTSRCRSGVLRGSSLHDRRCSPLIEDALVIRSHHQFQQRLGQSGPFQYPMDHGLATDIGQWLGRQARAGIACGDDPRMRKLIGSHVEAQLHLNASWRLDGKWAERVGSVHQVVHDDRCPQLRRDVDRSPCINDGVAVRWLSIHSRTPVLNKPLSSNEMKASSMLRTWLLYRTLPPRKPACTSLADPSGTATGSGT